MSSEKGRMIEAKKGELGKVKIFGNFILTSNEKSLIVVDKEHTQIQPTEIFTDTSYYSISNADSFSQKISFSKVESFVSSFQLKEGKILLFNSKTGILLKQTSIPPNFFSSSSPPPNLFKKLSNERYRIEMDWENVLITDQWNNQHLLWNFLEDKIQMIEGDLNAIEIHFISSHLVIFYGGECVEEWSGSEKATFHFPYYHMKVFSKNLNWKSCFYIDKRIYWKKRWGNHFQLSEKFLMFVEKEIVIFDSKSLNIELKKLNEQLFYFPSASLRSRSSFSSSSSVYHSLNTLHLKEKVNQKSAFSHLKFIGQVLDVDTHYRLLAIESKDEQSIIVRGLFHPNKEIGKLNLKKKEAILSIHLKEGILLLATQGMIEMFDIQGKHLRSIQLSNYKLSANSVFLDNHYIYAFGSGAVKISLKTYQEVQWNYLRICIFGKEGNFLFFYLFLFFISPISPFFYFFYLFLLFLPFFIFYFFLLFICLFPLFLSFF